MVKYRCEVCIEGIIDRLGCHKYLVDMSLWWLSFNMLIEEYATMRVCIGEGAETRKVTEELGAYKMEKRRS